MPRPPLPKEEKPIFFCRVEVQRHLIKKNSRQIMFNKRTNRPFLGKNNRARQFEDHLIAQMIKAKLDFKLFEPISSPIQACFRFYFSDFYTKQGKQRATLPDMSNLYQGPEDALQAAGVITNDTIIENHDGSRRLPGVANILEIWLWKADV